MAQDHFPEELAVQLNEPRGLGLVVNGVRAHPVCPLQYLVDAGHMALLLSQIYSWYRHSLPGAASLSSRNAWAISA